MGVAHRQHSGNSARVGGSITAFKMQHDAIVAQANKLEGWLERQEIVVSNPHITITANGMGVPKTVKLTCNYRLSSDSGRALLEVALAEAMLELYNRASELRRTRCEELQAMMDKLMGKKESR